VAYLSDLYGSELKKRELECDVANIMQMQSLELEDKKSKEDREKVYDKYRSLMQEYRECLTHVW
jgi:hypothetical protein